MQGEQVFFIGVFVLQVKVQLELVNLSVFIDIDFYVVFNIYQEVYNDDVLVIGVLVKYVGKVLFNLFQG